MKGSHSAKSKLQNPNPRPARTSVKERASQNARAARTSKLPAPNSKPQIASAARTAEILAILHKWGIHTLGQLAALNKEELRNRLGTDAVRLWERANGTATRLLKFVQLPGMRNGVVSKHSRFGMQRIAAVLNQTVRLNIYSALL